MTPTSLIQAIYMGMATARSMGNAVLDTEKQIEIFLREQFAAAVHDFDDEHATKLLELLKRILKKQDGEPSTSSTILNRGDK